MKYIKESVRSTYQKVFPKAMEYGGNIWVNSKPGKGIILLTKMMLEEYGINFNTIMVSSLNPNLLSNLSKHYFNEDCDLYILDNFRTLNIPTIRQLLLSISLSDDRFIIFTTNASDKVKKEIKKYTDIKCIDLDDFNQNVQIIKKINDFN